MGALACHTPTIGREARLATVKLHRLHPAGRRPAWWTLMKWRFRVPAPPSVPPWKTLAK